MITLLLCIIFAPLVALFALWFSSKLVSTPWKTTPEAGVRLLYFLAIRLQAGAEACDSGLVCFRDAAARPVRPHCELARMIKEAAQRDEAEHEALIERTKGELAEVQRGEIRILGEQA